MSHTDKIMSAGSCYVPEYARKQSHISLKESSYDRSGGDADGGTGIPAGETRDIFTVQGPGVITHIWFTTSARTLYHLKEIVLRIYWDEQKKPSVETPLGDFFGLNLGAYHGYESAFLNCSSLKALNCYFAMPFRKSARIAITNESTQNIGEFFYNIDYQLVRSLPADSLYFHAQYRQASPHTAVTFPGSSPEVNLDGKMNHVFCETRGEGQLLGVTLGVLQNSDGWMGEGDEMIFIDDETKPAINGTGLEDYFTGAWCFQDGAFAYRRAGAHLISNPFLAGGRTCMYRWHAENPITFRKYLKHTIEHGHANDRADNFYSVAYWYQTVPYTDFPALPSVEQRIPAIKTG